ncbi:MAG: nickel pincer cofactor biosynthesis protein LarC [Christensenella sp.]|nr:nickel pincer cofactor biosynthesis protein LarC [Christensenella sp.]
MKTLYLECNMGAAGDMLMGALLELLPDPIGFIAEMNALGLPGVYLTATKSSKCGIFGTHVHVSVHGEHEKSMDVSGHDHSTSHQDHCHSHEHFHDHKPHHHSSLHDIEHLISHLTLPDAVRQDAIAVYRLIAEAEGYVHGKPAAEIHFHEVGTLDAITDIVGVCLLVYKLSPDHIVASPIHVGSGQVSCAHGILPVPAPATVFLLRNIPIYSGSILGELCTPTGAALLKHFVSAFGPMPVMSLYAIGYGMGKKDFDSANCIRAFWGEETSEDVDTIMELRCNLDDMTPEDISFAQERLFEAGAVDVFCTPVYMKKNRPGILLTCLCAQGLREGMIRLLFQHTTTIGIRESLCSRSILRRIERRVSTPCGEVRIKESSGFGVQRQKYEYDDLARLAKEHNCSITDIKKIIELHDNH